MKKLLYITLLIFICSCATPMRPERVKAELNQIQIPLLTGEPKCKYEIISALSENTYDEWGYSSAEEATLKLKKKAQALGANAVINFKSENTKVGGGAMLYGVAAASTSETATVSGMAIKCIDGKIY